MNYNQFIYTHGEILETLELSRARIVETQAIGNEYGAGDKIDTNAQRGQRLVGFAYSYCDERARRVRLTLIATDKEIHIELPAIQFDAVVEWIGDCQYSHGERPPEVEAAFNRKDSADTERFHRRRERNKAAYPGLWWRQFEGLGLKPLSEKERRLLPHAKYDYYGN